MTKKQRQMANLPANSPRVKAAQIRYANDPSAQTLSVQALKDRGKGHFRFKK